MCHTVSHPSRGRTVSLIAAFAVAVCPNLAPSQPGGWSFETVVSGGFTTGGLSLALSEFGGPRICYRHLGQLKYAYRDASGWHFETADSIGSGSLGHAPSLVLDTLGRPRISHHDATNDDLKYTYRNATGWHDEIVDSVGEVDSYTSLVLDASAHPHISYQGVYDEDQVHCLKYAYRDESGWHAEIVDYTSASGASTSIALNAFGQPRISYRHYASSDLRYAYRDGSGWQIETVDEAGEVGAHSSLALDNLGRPRISYRDATNQDLKYAYRGFSAWTIEVVDSTGNVGQFTSLALDASGFPHISYFDPTNWDLKYAYRDASEWHVHTVDWDGSMGYTTSLALDGSGLPHIAYGDMTNHAVKYARGVSDISLSGALDNDQLVLTWTTLPDASDYWVYGASNLPHFPPGGAPGYEYRLAVITHPDSTWSSTSGVTDPEANRTYLVSAVNATEQLLGVSNRVGEFDFQAEIP
ncbi:hypothetical protein JXA88_08170 [Candidatus Fermentibacteria bacterium]|nr:hypothetical protein [Candidatus Fermentibacteria bacterium]